MKETNDTLAQLVTRPANGRSQAELEAACGGVPSRSRNRQIMKYEVKAPRLAGLLPAKAEDLDDTQIAAVRAVVSAMNSANASRD